MNSNSLSKKLADVSFDNKELNVIHVGDISLNTTANELKEVFKGLNVTNIIMKKTLNGQYAFAFVKFDSANAAQEAVKKYNYTVLNGKEILLTISDTQFKYSQSANIFVNNIPTDMSAKDLEEIFKNFGPVLSCKISRTSEGKSKGYGYVMYKNLKSAKKAVTNCQNVKINENILFVDFYNPQKLARNSENKAFTNCFCKNFPPNYTESELKNLLKKYGEITTIYFPTKSDGEPVGFACVNYAHPDSAIRAINELHNKQIFNNNQMQKDNKFAIEPFYIQKNEKKKEREQILKSFYGNSVGFRNKLKRNLFIQNVPTSFSEDELLEILKKFGNITDFKLKADTLHPDKQFGYVCYSTVEEAAVALEKSKQVLLDGNQLELSIYKSKYERNTESSYIMKLEGNYDLNNIDEKKVSVLLYDLLMSKAEMYKESFSKVGVENNKGFADIISRQIVSLSIDTLKEFIKDHKKLDDYIKKVIKKIMLKIN